MQSNDAERLMEIYSRDYMEKVFYFCLRRTGDAYEAEDLTSDISLSILSALRGGAIPRHFPAWVCQYDIIRTNGKILDFQGVLAFVGAHSIPFPALKGGTN